MNVFLWAISNVKNKESFIACDMFLNMSKLTVIYYTQYIKTQFCG